MKTSWIVWLVIIGVFVTLLIAFNYRGSDDVIPLSDIFSDEEVYPVDVEYEFVDSVSVGNEVAPDMSTKKEKIVHSSVSEKKSQSVDEKANLVLEPKPVKKKAVKKTILANKGAENFSYAIQIISSKFRDKALDKVEELKRLGHFSYIVSRNLGDKGVWFRVYVGKFKSKNEANSYLIGLKNEYPDSFVIFTQ